jgi:apyrase
VTAGSSENGTLVDPCAPKGYSHKRRVTVKTSGASRSNLENQYVDNGSGDFKECRSSSLMMIQEGKGKKCMHVDTLIPFS